MLLADVLEALDEENLYFDKESLMTYQLTPTKGVYKKYTVEGEHRHASDTLFALFLMHELSSRENREKIVNALIKALTLPISDDSEHVHKSLYCRTIKLQHDCIRFKDFAIDIPRLEIITDERDLDKLCTSHYDPSITLANRLASAIHLSLDEQEPMLAILKNNNEYNKETLYTLIENSVCRDSLNFEEEQCQQRLFKL